MAVPMGSIMYMYHKMTVAVNMKLLIIDRFQISLLGTLVTRHHTYRVPHVVICITSAAVNSGGINTFVLSSLDQPFG